MNNKFNIQSLTVKNSKKVDKTCDSCDYYLGDKFLFNEVDCYSKNGKISSYQYFNQLVLTKKQAEDIAKQYNGYIHPHNSIPNRFFVYFSNVDLAMNFVRSEIFEQYN